VQALLTPGIYPEATSKVELMQTQMSFVFLTDAYAYKVKKPVNLGYLDYSTLAQRHFFCQREVELNQRLCPATYLAVVPLTRENGTISIGGQGQVIEYAVKMRRLPQEKMMNVLLAKNEVSIEMVTAVARKLAEFHRRAETNATISDFGQPGNIAGNTGENFSQTVKYIGKTLSREQYHSLKTYTEKFMSDKVVLFRKRIAGNKIRDCHGDLHAAHICFTDGICIYDCIEFNDRFRYCDVASEVAFLAMDLDHYGRADLSRSFVAAYVTFSKDEGLPGLLNFYKCYRAYVRGKVEGFKLDDPYIAEPEKKQILDIARSYFDLAQTYTRSRPFLLITTGLVGTGKSTLAQALAKRLGLVVISSDITRKKLADVPVTDRHLDDFGRGIYSPEFSRLTYDKMLAEARGILAEGGSVILDASFIKAAERRRALALAKEAPADFFIVECVLDEESIKLRLAERFRQGSVSDGRWEIFEPQKQQFEPVVEVSPQNHVIIDSSKPLSEATNQVLEKLFRNLSP